MRFTVEAWAPEYGAPIETEELERARGPVDVSIEVPAAEWRARAPRAEPGDQICVVFVDGVRRVDARVWLEGADGGARLGICATYAAGLVRADGRAQVRDIKVERGLFTATATAEPVRTRYCTFPVRTAAGDTVDKLSLALQQRMGELEALVAERAGAAALVVVDGPLRGSRAIPNAIGYVKSHLVGYLPPLAEEVVATLRPGERTPLFVTTGAWSLYSWYVRLPGGAGHPWAGIVRCEADANLEVREAVALADLAAVVLPRFASCRHKEPRAPQNLYPIAGLERELRRRSGDAQLVYRALLAESRRS